MTETSPISVVVADSEALFGDALAIALGEYDGVKVFGGQPTHGPDAVQEVVRHRPDVAVLDYWLSSMEGPAATVLIRARAPKTKVVLLSWFHGPREVHYAVAAGAAGLLPKNISLDETVRCLRRAHTEEGPVIPLPLAKMLEDPLGEHRRAALAWKAISTLTPREFEVLGLLAEGLATADIARRQKVSPATVQRHVHHILAKTQTSSQFEALEFARHYRLVP